MKTINLWHYAIWLVVIRFLLPISIVVLLVLTGIDLTNVGIPYLSAILAAAIAGRATARSAQRMPRMIEILRFAVAATLFFFFVNYVAYFLLALSGIGPVDMFLFRFWHRSGQIVELMAWLTVWAFFSNSVIFWLATKAELRAMGRKKQKT